MSNPNGFNQEELRCLSAALGFHEDIFAKHIPDLLTEKNVFVETKVLYGLIENKVFDTDLHKTYNLHIGVYNVEVLCKAIHVLSNKIASFEDLKNLRIAFDLYECDDLSGLETKPERILAVLKMSGRVLSPKFLVDHLRHTPRTSTDRLTFYEFLDLISLCKNIEDVKKRLKPQKCSSSSVSEVVDFMDILSQEDKRVLAYLDQEYMESCFRPPFVPKPTWRVPPEDIINDKEWKEQVASNQKLTSGIDSTLNKSQKKVLRVKNGCLNEAGQFIDLNITNNGQRVFDIPILEEMENIIEPENSHSKNVEETKKTLSTTSKTQFSKAISAGPSDNSCKKKLSTTPKKSTMNRNVDVLVCEKDMQVTQAKIIDLLWRLQVEDKVGARDVEDQKTRIQVSESQEQTGKRGERQETLPEEKDPINEVTGAKEQEKLDRPSTEDNRQCTQSDLYDFLRSRSEQRDFILDRPTAKDTRISKTQQGGSRESRNDPELCRQFLSTA